MSEQMCPECAALGGWGVCECVRAEERKDALTRRAEAAERSCEDAKRREQEASAKMQAMAQSESNKALRARAEAAEAESAALRLMLRETAATNTSGITYALRCQRERDEAVAECERQRKIADDRLAAFVSSADVGARLLRQRNEARASLTTLHRRAQEAERLVGLAMRVGVAECEAMRARMQSAERELHRIACGEQVEGDGLCEYGIEAAGLRGAATIAHDHLMHGRAGIACETLRAALDPDEPARVVEAEGWLRGMEGNQ